MKMKFKIKGIDCAHCAAELERKLQRIENIKEASIIFMTERMIIECDEEVKKEIMEKVRNIIRKEEPDVTIEEI